jgi:hypothetical protein
VYLPWYDLLVNVALIFGVYMAAVGVAVVFATLLALFVVIWLLKRMAGDGDGKSISDKRLKRVAAVAAVYYLTGPKAGLQPLVKVRAFSQWSASARLDVLGKYRGGFDEKKI